MSVELRFQCECGTLQGIAFDVAPSSGSHVICYCQDCQAFAHCLDKSDQVLDSHGGSDIFQMSQGLITFTTGADRLACLRLTPKGLIRWYASCCNTPLANTMATRALPFVGMLARNFTSDGAASVEPLGPVIAHAFRKSARGDLATLPRDRMAMPLVFLRAALLLSRWMLRRDGKRSPFFDSRSDQLHAVPRILGSAERAALALRVAAAPDRHG